MDQRPGDGHPLLLATGEVAAFLSHHGIQPLRHMGQVPRQCAVPQSPLHLFISKFLAQGDVLPNGGIEEEYVLLDVAHLSLELLRRIVPGVCAVEPNGSRIVRQPPQKQLQEGGFPATGRTSQRILLPLFKAQIPILQNSLFAIPEAQVLHSNPIAHRQHLPISFLQGAVVMDGNLLKIWLAGGDR